MNRLQFFTLAPALALLCSCTLTATDNTEGTSSSSAAEQSSVRETRNVAYSGTVETAGISIYMEGTHRLTLPEGKFILLESDTVDLNGYVNEKAKVTGSIRPTVEAGGMIMRVDRIELEDSASSASEVISSSVQASSETKSSAQSVTSSAMSSTLPTSSFASTTTSQMLSSVAVSSKAISSVANTSSVTVTASSSESSEGTGTPEQIEAMSRQDLAPSLWTQQYCTSHIGFCVPVHKNWWFRSFGATSTELWRVEVSSEPIENLREGPIVIRLLTDANAADDGTVRVENGMVVFIKSWTLDRHFEIVADASLEAAVRYIGTHVEEFEQEL